MAGLAVIHHFLDPSRLHKDTYYPTTSTNPPNSDFFFKIIKIVLSHSYHGRTGVATPTSSGGARLAEQIISLGLRVVAIAAKFAIIPPPAHCD